MALNINLIALIRDRVPDRRGRVLTLGKQRVTFDAERFRAVLDVEPPAELDQAAVFRALGYDSVESLDFSDYEGADHIFDLNQPAAPEHLLGAYDLVLTGGTLEHVFHVSTALRHAASFVRPGGRLLHLGPANGWINHGFYQLCPGLLLDWLAANDWALELSALADVIDRRRGRWRVSPGLHRVRASGARQLHVCAARRETSSRLDAVPTQRRYSEAQPAAQVQAFDSFDLVEGAIVQR